MNRVESLEKEVRQLTPEELAEFRAWFLEYDAAEWDRQITSDARGGKLDSLIREAKADYDAGRSTEM